MKHYSIFYAKEPSFGGGNDGYCLSGLRETHAEVKTIEATSLGDAFMQMQGENWSPNGEARDLIQSLGLQHTSMSVGDIAYEVEAGIGHLAECVGWVHLPVLSKEYLEQQIMRQLSTSAPTIMDTCRRLIKSGAVSISGEENVSLQLANSILSAALEDYIDLIRPHDQYYKDVYSNLKHF